MLDIKPNLSTAFHPESDGQTERINQVLETHLRIFCDYLQDDWSQLLPIAEFSYNCTYHSTIGTTPFYANKAYHPRLSVTLKDCSVPDAETRLRRIEEIQDFCKNNIRKAAEQHAFYANRKRTPAPAFEPGERVWLLRRFIHTDRPSSKLDAKKLGPFLIESRVGQSAYRLTLPETMQIHNVFHVSLLEKYHSNHHPAREIREPPPPVIKDDGSEAYIVESILDSKYRGRNRRLEYFVHWQGYPVSDRSWIYASDLRPDDDLVIDFHTKHPTKPGYSRLHARIRSRRARA